MINIYDEIQLNTGTTKSDQNDQFMIFVRHFNSIFLTI